MLEKNYAWLWELGINKNCNITSPKYYRDKDNGEQRETDVYIEELDNNGKVVQTIMVECRNRKREQDVRWIEEIIGKKHSLNPDRVIVVSTSPFSKPARQKAKVHGIEVERSSSLDLEFIQNQIDGCKGQMNFIFMECVGLQVITSKGCYDNNQLKEFTEIINYIKYQINAFSYSDNFVSELQANKLSRENNPTFFDNENNFISVVFSFIPAPIGFLRNSFFRKPILLDLECDNSQKIGKIERISFQLKVTPKNIDFPLSRLITIFDDDVPIEKSNKRHKSLFENDEVKIIFQIHNDRMYNETTIKRIRKYWRHIGQQCTIYALLGNVDNNKVEFKITNLPEELVGEIYFDTIFDNNKNN